MNRVLTLDEVAAMPSGERVCFDTRSDGVVVLDGAVPVSALLLVFGQKARDEYCAEWRVWLREPTPDELAANPWPEVPHAAE